MIRKAGSFDPRIVIVGGGPAGLMAAEYLSNLNLAVDLYERNPSVGRKFLVAGKSGLNLSRDERLLEFADHYGSAREQILPALLEFGPNEVRDWAKSHNMETFIGSSGKIFPIDMKGASLLRNWKADLIRKGVRIHTGWKWIDLDPEARILTFQKSEKFYQVGYGTVLFALGGASWPVTGSTGEWVDKFIEHGFKISPLKPANMGFEVDWSDHLTKKFEGQAIKTVTLSYQLAGGLVRSKVGEFVITRYGIEGNLIYAHSSFLRDIGLASNDVIIEIDLLPEIAIEQISAKLSQRNQKRSLATNLERIFSLSKPKIGLLWEADSALNKLNNDQLAKLIKHLPIRLNRFRPINEAISTAGGIQFEQLDEYYMSKTHPGIYFAGEMLDWEAPTGGYLLNGVMATGLWAAKSIYRHTQEDQ